LFPDKAKMVRSADALFVMLAVATGIYLVIAVLVTFGKPGFARDPNFTLWLFLGLAFVSLANIGVTIFVETSTRLMSERARYDPIGRTYLIMSLGAILSEAHSIYGLVLALLSGSIFYGIGFTIVAWASLWWVRKRFRQSLAGLPDA
jgi:F0F1-type ATP synthase membrane subunit c/vacuolar-type H+-ATPase subunit K